jgi:hypothetical protein
MNETRLGADQLAALAAVIEFGSFDGAAERLHVTPSAVSQRIKALEHRVGQVLVVREKPCRPTAARVLLLRFAAQAAMLESEALAETGCGRIGGADSHHDRGQCRFDVDVVHDGVRSTAGSVVRHPDRGPGPLGVTATRGRGHRCGHHRAHPGAGVSGAVARCGALRTGREA